jgi:hypothetical protein
MFLRLSRFKRLCTVAEFAVDPHRAIPMAGLEADTARKITADSISRAVKRRGRTAIQSHTGPFLLL